MISNLTLDDYLQQQRCSPHHYLCLHALLRTATPILIAGHMASGRSTLARTLMWEIAQLDNQTVFDVLLDNRQMLVEPPAASPVALHRQMRKSTIVDDLRNQTAIRFADLHNVLATATSIGVSWGTSPKDAVTRIQHLLSDAQLPSTPRHVRRLYHGIVIVKKGIITDVTSFAHADDEGYTLIEQQRPFTIAANWC